ncbi:hypothetical protein CSC40_2185 [Klebsiella pneumoniae]|nr:hypothetical protein CSC40_2185 [Klebsiella pneumoniae]
MYCFLLFGQLVVMAIIHHSTLGKCGLMMMEIKLMRMVVKL